MFEGECFLKTRSEKLQKSWGVVMGNEFYCYLDKSKT
jgi:hypothetical protein